MKAAIHTPVDAPDALLGGGWSLAACGFCVLDHLRADASCSPASVWVPGEQVDDRPANTHRCTATRAAPRYLWLPSRFSSRYHLGERRCRKTVGRERSAPTGTDRRRIDDARRPHDGVPLAGACRMRQTVT